MTVNELPSVRSEFAGYGGLSAAGTIVAILVDGASVERVEQGANAQLILNRTAFYAEKGGQIGDRGEIVAGENGFDVTDTQTLRTRRSCITASCGAARVRGRRYRGNAGVSRVARGNSPSPHLGAFAAARAARRAWQRCRGKPVRGSASTACASIFAAPGGALSAEQKRRVVQRVNEMIREDHRLETRELPISEAMGDRRDHDGGREIRRGGARCVGRTVGGILRRNARAFDRRARDVRS